MRRTLFVDRSGPLIEYADGVLLIEDLNPQFKATWRISRLELIRFGLRCILAAFSRPSA